MDIISIIYIIYIYYFYGFNYFLGRFYFCLIKPYYKSNIKNRYKIIL